MKYTTTKEQLEEAAKSSLSIAQMCRELGIVPRGGNYKTIRNKINIFNIDISHFTGQAWNTGTKYRQISRSVPLEEILKENSIFNTGSLKKKLIRANLKECKCEICNITNWNNKSLSFELDHINGNNTDNRLENLRILCPNCHSQTDTYRGKSIKSFKESLLKERYEEFKNSKEDSFQFTKNIKETKRRIKQEKHCKICNNLVQITGNIYCSKECHMTVGRINIPTYQELLNAFEIHKNFLQVGKHFNVSDNAVRKWCITYGIPIK